MNIETPLDLFVLAAEDEVASNIFLNKILKKYVKNFFVAEDGVEALEYFKANKDKIDVVITDVSMPNMDGLELTSRIREIDQEIPVILQTAFDDKQILLRAIELGIYQHLLKPINIKNLEIILNNIYKNKQIQLEYQKNIEYNNILSKALQESISLVAILNKDNTVEFVNTSFAKFLNRTIENLVGTSLIEYAFDARTPDDFDKFIRSVDNHLPYQGEILFSTSLTDPFWATITYTPFFNEIGEHTYSIAILDDITNKKLKEDQLIKGNVVLDKLIKERTAELEAINQALNDEIAKRIQYELELTEAKDFAEKANESKSIFLAKVSHELRTPMNGILGISSILKNMNLDDKTKKFIDTIYSSSENLLSIINDLLDFSKIKMGKFEAVKVEFDFYEEIDETMLLLEQIAINKKLSFFYRVDETIPKTLFGDAGKLKQLITNIVGNSIKFTKEGFVNIEIKRIDETDNNVKIEFVVQDSGIGIPDNKRNWIFESFMQLEPLMTRNYGGTGLGLSISKEIVDLMSGTIFFESKLGSGTTFYFSVVLDKNNAETSNSKMDKIEIHSNELLKEIELQNTIKYILYADPNKDNQKQFEKILSNSGITTFLVETGRDAIDFFSLRPTDIVFINTKIEQTNIIDTIVEIRKNEVDFSKHTPIIAINNPNNPFDKESAYNYGIDNYLELPINIKQLMNLLNEISDQQKNQLFEFDLKEIVNTQSKDIILKVIEHFSHTYKPLIFDLEQAIEKNEYKSIFEASNKIRYALSGFGVLRTIGLATKISKKALLMDSTNIDILFNALKWEVDQIAKQISEINLKK